MKRAILVCVFILVAGLFVPARAACDGPLIGGQYDTAHASIGAVTIHVEGYTQTFTPNSVQVCSDGTVHNDATNAHLTITVDGIGVVCDRADYPMDADPFTFGDSHRTVKPNPDPAGDPLPDGPCGVDMSWSNLLPTFGPGTEGFAAGVAYAQAGVHKDVPLAGSYWYGGGAPVRVAPGTMGYFTRGARVDVTA